MSRKSILIWAVIFGMSAFWRMPARCLAQPQFYNHPELKWFSIETEHFYVHFHNGAERTAKVVAKIAEEIYEPITSLYQFRPSGKYHFIIKDHDDYSNGGAFFYDNKIEIWATPMRFELRGTHDWLRNVVTHEFTHMVQLQSARKITRRIPAFYLQAIGYESTRREDVLHGGPNVIASYPFAMTVMPGWFAEGVAQFQIPGLEYETWDSHRDMILRTATLDDKLLTYNQMGVFGKNSLGNEKVYNHGYAFVSYLVQQYGLETVRTVSHNMKSFFRLSLDGALKKATGKSGRQLYKDWTTALREQYVSQTSEIRKNKVEGKILEASGLANLNPVWSPEGTRIAYHSNRGRDYMSQTQLMVRNMQSGKTEAVAAGRYAIAWSPDGRKLAFASNSARSKGGSRYYDIYSYELDSRNKTRETRAQRAHSPDWSADGKKLVYITAKDGTENLEILHLDSREKVKITHFQNGEQLHQPRWSPDGKSVLFTLSRGNHQDLYLKDLENGELMAILEDPADSRDAVFGADGRHIYFSWDKTGIYNIYSLDLTTKKTVQWTNVIGGAFMPSVSRNGALVFSLFTSDGYKISVIEKPLPVRESSAPYLTLQEGPQFASVKTHLQDANISKINVHNFDDSQLPDFQIKPYKNQYSSLTFLPRVMLDYGTVKVGTYLYSYDVLNKYGFLAGFDVNRRGDYDLFTLIEYRNFGPTLFLEAYNQIQHTKARVDDPKILLGRGLFDETVDKFKFNLAEVDAGVSFKLSDANELRTAFVYSRYGVKANLNFSTGPVTLHYKYFIGRDISVRFTHRGFVPAVDSEINPTGRFILLEYDFEFNKFLEDFETDQPVSIEKFSNFNYHKFTVDWKENWRLPLKNHTINFVLQAGFITTKDDTLEDGTFKDDSFFYFFGGGLFGNRGYPYFSIEGRKSILGRVTYRLPLVRNLDLRFMHLYFDKIFLGLFVDYGNAFNENKLNFDKFKTSVGVQLRMDSFSFYSYPTRVFFDAAYGLNKFQFANQTYGNEWRFYFGLSFGFLD
ncbi:MAG: biopolymer transporter Tol [bacterium]